MANAPNRKNTLYYCSRYLGWFLLFAALVIRPTEKLLDLVETKLGNSIFIELISGLLVIALEVYCHKVVLEKTFFKKYKHIIVTPKFNEITWWFNIKTYVELTLISLLAIGIVLGVYAILFPNMEALLVDQLNNPIEMLAFIPVLIRANWTMIPIVLISCIIVRCILLNRIVSKNADIYCKMNEE